MKPISNAFLKNVDSKMGSVLSHTILMILLVYLNAFLLLFLLQSDS